MNYKEIEEILKENYKSTQPEEFSERFSRIQDKLYYPEQKQEAVVKSKELVGVGANGKTSNAVATPGRVKLVILICAAAMVLGGVIGILFWQLFLPKENSYAVAIDDLLYSSVSKDEFFNALQDNSIETIAFENLDNFINSYSLVKDQNGIIYGGAVELFNEDIGYEANIKFYSICVTGISEVQEPCDVYNLISGITVNYVMTVDGEDEPIYETTASAQYKKLNYYIEYTSLDDNALNFFNNIFI